MSKTFRAFAVVLVVGLVPGALSLSSAGAVTTSTTTTTTTAATMTTSAAGAAGVTALRGPARRSAAGLFPGSPMPGEKVAWTGTTKAKGVRAVVQAAKGKRWRKVTVVSTDRKGRFFVPVTGERTPSSVKYRLVSGNRTLAKRTISTVAQGASLSAPVSIGGNQVEMTATFTPARQGRRVSLMNSDGSRWSFGPNAYQDAAGQVTFKVTMPGAGGALTVRASAFPHEGAASMSSNTQTVTGATTPTPDPTPTATPTGTPTAAPDPVPAVVVPAGPLPSA